MLVWVSLNKKAVRDTIYRAQSKLLKYSRWGVIRRLIWRLELDSNFWILAADCYFLNSTLSFQYTSLINLRRPNLQGAHLPVPPDLAKTVKVWSDQSEDLTFLAVLTIVISVKNAQISFGICLKVFRFVFYQNLVKSSLWCVIGWVTRFFNSTPDFN